MTRTYFERRFMTHGHFDMGYSESTFSKYAFGRGRGSQKRVRLYARENDDNSGPPLRNTHVCEHSVVVYEKMHSPTMPFSKFLD